MSISRDSMTKDNWLHEDIQAQTRLETYKVENASLTGGANEQFGGGPPNVQPVDNDDGLAHNEVAELVGIELKHATAHFRDLDASGTETGSFWFEYDLTTREDTDATKTSLEAQTTDDGVYEGVNEAQDQYLIKLKMTAGQSAMDTTNGAGAGGMNANISPYFINYRDAFGRGPIFTDRDNLGAGYAFNVQNVSDEDPEAKVGYTMYWDVFEVESPDYKDII